MARSTFTAPDVRRILFHPPGEGGWGGGFFVVSCHKQLDLKTEHWCRLCSNVDGGLLQTSFHSLSELSKPAPAGAHLLALACAEAAAWYCDAALQPRPGCLMLQAGHCRQARRYQCLCKPDMACAPAAPGRGGGGGGGVLLHQRYRCLILPMGTLRREALGRVLWVTMEFCITLSHALLVPW